MRRVIILLHFIRNFNRERFGAGDCYVVSEYRIELGNFFHCAGDYRAAVSDTENV